MVSVIARPQVALVDEPVTLTVTGLQASQECTIRIETLDHAGQTWTGQQSHIASFDGSVELRSPMSLFTGMTPGVGHRGGPFATDSTTTLLFGVKVQANGSTVAETEIHRVFRDVGVSTTPIRQDGVVGTLFLPSGPGPHPGVLILGGDQPGYRDATAALLASRGFAALRLITTGHEGLPPVLSEVPVDKVESALELLGGHAAVAGPRVAVLGHSTGGELALLVAASFPHLVRSVVAVAGSPVIFSGLGDGQHVGAYGRSRWAYHGTPVPFVQLPLDEDLYRAGEGYHRAYEQALGDTTAVAAATIPLERIDGPVLLVSGTADPVWPAERLAALAAGRLRDRGRSVEHLSYNGAGHVIGFPYLPMSDPDARATADAWPRIVDFLHPANPVTL